MAKPELGTKRTCPETGRKFYDLNKDPIVSPFTGTAYPRSAFEAPERAKASPVRAAPAPAVLDEEEAEVEIVADRDPELVSLEEVEEDAEPDVGPDLDEDETVIPDADAIEIEADIEPDDDAAFLPEEEEEGDDVAGLLDVEGEDEDEV